MWIRFLCIRYSRRHPADHGSLPTRLINKARHVRRLTPREKNMSTVAKVNYQNAQFPSTNFAQRVELNTTERDIVLAFNPNWDALYGRVLAGDLKPIFDDVCEAAENSTAIALRYFNLVEAFKICTEQALRDCLDKLIQAGYVISEEHKTMWNAATAELNFSELVRIT